MNLMDLRDGIIVATMEETVEWREEFSKSLLQLGNFAMLALAFNAALNPNAQWSHILGGGLFS